MLVVLYTVDLYVCIYDLFHIFMTHLWIHGKCVCVCVRTHTHLTNYMESHSIRLKLHLTLFPISEMC